jgi:hypothetical protein
LRHYNDVVTGQRLDILLGPGTIGTVVRKILPVLLQRKGGIATLLHTHLQIDVMSWPSFGFSRVRYARVKSM